MFGFSTNFDLGLYKGKYTMGDSYDVIKYKGIFLKIQYHQTKGLEKSYIFYVRNLDIHHI
jgi:hypothetical protein